MASQPVTHDWDAIFAWMVRSGARQSEAAKRFDVPGGTVNSRVKRERDLPGMGRLKGYSVGRTVAIPTTPRKQARDAAVAQYEPTATFAGQPLDKLEDALERAVLKKAATGNTAAMAQARRIIEEKKQQQAEHARCPGPGDGSRRPVGFGRVVGSQQEQAPPPLLPDTASMDREEFLVWQVRVLTHNLAMATAGSVAAVQNARELSARHAELSALRDAARLKSGADLDEMDDDEWQITVAEEAAEMPDADKEVIVREYIERHKLRLVPEEAA